MLFNFPKLAIRLTGGFFFSLFNVSRPSIAYASFFAFWRYSTKYVILFIIFIFTLNNVFGEIKNGYEKEIRCMRESLKDLRDILNENNNLSIFQWRKIEATVKLLVNNITHYELTENLLHQFKIIAPILYNEIDTLKDRKGRAVNVYVKFIPIDATDVKTLGTTYMSQSEKDLDASCSEYGELTVSVKIWTVNKALLVLSHELGHVKYQVPHLATYMEYYKKHYNNNCSNYLGHDSNDPSGKSASRFEQLFRKEFIYFLKTSNLKIQSPVVLMETIRKNLRKI